jgi:hypothetical protein
MTRHHTTEAPRGFRADHGYASNRLPGLRQRARERDDTDAESQRAKTTVSITFAPIRPRTQPTQFWFLPRLDKGLTTALASDVRLWALAVEDGS